MKTPIIRSAGTLFRAALLAVSGYLVGAGFLSTEESDVLMQLVMDMAIVLTIAFPVLWEIVTRWREGNFKSQLQTALDVPADERIGPVTLGAAEALKAEVLALSARLAAAKKKR